MTMFLNNNMGGKPEYYMKWMNDYAGYTLTNAIRTDYHEGTNLLLSRDNVEYYASLVATNCLEYLAALRDAQ